MHRMAGEKAEHPIKSKSFSEQTCQNNTVLRVQIIKVVFSSNVDKVHLKKEFDRQRGHKRYVSSQYVGNFEQFFLSVEKIKAVLSSAGLEQEAL